MDARRGAPSVGEGPHRAPRWRGRLQLKRNPLYRNKYEPGSRSTRCQAACQALIDAASDVLAHGNISQSEWYRAGSDALADAYLAESDPRWQSGFDGDPELWRQARAFVLDALPHSGSFLDLGAATGHLIERLPVWARKRGITLEVFGLELSPRLAVEACRRLPERQPIRLARAVRGAHRTDTDCWIDAPPPHGASRCRASFRVQA